MPVYIHACVCPVQYVSVKHTKLVRCLIQLPTFCRTSWGEDLAQVWPRRWVCCRVAHGQQWDENTDTWIPLPASFIYTIFQPNEGPRCGYRAKCGVAQSIWYWIEDTHCNLARYESLHKWALLEIRFSIRGSILFVQNWLQLFSLQLN